MTAKKSTASNTAKSTAWEMTRGIVRDLEAAIAKAREELTEAQKRHAGEPFRTMKEQRILEALVVMQREGLPDVLQVARANRLEL